VGAEVPFKVRVLKLVEETIEVYGVTESDAKEEARCKPDVAIVLEVIYD
jgi:hypothetical protein